MGGLSVAEKVPSREGKVSGGRVLGRMEAECLVSKRGALPEKPQKLFFLATSLQMGIARKKENF